MRPRIEPPPPDSIKRAVTGTQAWPLGESDISTHEAGHVVVALALGMPVYNARIAADGTTGRAGVLAPVGDTTSTPLAPEAVADIYRQAAPLIWPGMDTAEAALNYSTMLVAGRQAELIAAGIPLLGELRMHDPDHLQARAVLSQSGQRLCMAWAQRMARHLLTTAWADVEAIAATLRTDFYWNAPYNKGDTK
jgi:hypothetical protein